MNINKLVDKLGYQVVNHFLPHKLSFAQKVRGQMIISNLKKGNVLDVGVGCGWISRLMVERGFKVTSVDSADKVIKINEWFGKQSGLKLKLVKANVYKLPFEDNSFDNVVVCEMLEHLDDPGLALQEVSRVLKKNGRFILTIPGYTYTLVYDKLFDFLRKKRRFNYDKRMSDSLKKFDLNHSANYEDEHRFKYTISKVKSLIEQSSMKVVKIENVELFSPFFNTLLTNLLGIKREKLKLLEQIDVILMKILPLVMGSDWMYISKKMYVHSRSY